MSELSSCPIPGATGFCQPEGTGANGVLVLGEAMGEQEARDGLPFRPFAPAGSLLERAFARCGYSRQQFVLYNTVPTQPPHNYLEGAKYEMAAINWGLQHVKKVIDDYKPRAILALGNIPLKALTGMAGEQRSITHLQNWVLPSRYAIPVVPALHPAFIRRGALPLFSVLMHCIKLAVAVANTPVGQTRRFFSPVLWRDYDYRQPEHPCDCENPRVPDGYITYPSGEDADEFVRRVSADPRSLVAYDIETPRSRTVTENDSDELEDTQILSIQFSLAPRSGIFMPWWEPYIECAKAIMASPNPKAGANTWRFDDPLLEAHHVRLNGARHDVRWAFRHLQPDLKAALQFVSSFYMPLHEYGPWKHLHSARPEAYGIFDVDAVQWIMNGVTN